MNEFEYKAPRTLGDALAALATGGCRPLAGGTDLIVQLRERRREARVVVDVKRIPELAALARASDGAWTIGAAVPCCHLYENAELAAAYPAIADAAALIGGIQIQSRASLGGNLCNASPAADGVPPLIAHAARCRIAGPRGEREVAVEAFCTGPGKTVLAAGEILVSFRLPAPAPRTGSRYLRFIPRNEMDIAVVGVGAAVTLDAQGLVIACRLALGAVAPTPLFLDAASRVLVGKKPEAAVIEAAAEEARRAARPIDDMRGTVWQRRHLAGVLTRRALEDAVARARGETR